MIWTRRKFRNTPKRSGPDWLEGSRPRTSELPVVMEPTRNAWVIVSAPFRALGASVVLVAPEQSVDLRRY